MAIFEQDQAPTPTQVGELNIRYWEGYTTRFRYQGRTDMDVTEEGLNDAEAYMDALARFADSPEEVRRDTILSRLERLYRSGVPQRQDVAPEDVNKLHGHVLPMNYVEDFGGGLPTAGTRRCCYYDSSKNSLNYLMIPEIFLGPTGKVFPIAQIASGMALDTSTRIGKNIARALGSLIGFNEQEYIAGLKEYGMQVWVIPRVAKLPDNTFGIQNVDFVILPTYVTERIKQAYGKLNGVRYVKTDGGYKGLRDRDAWAKFVGGSI